MHLTERNTDTPSGLARFLTLHDSCERGLEILRDESLVTILCHGCGSSFSYLSKVAPSEPSEVERALQELATPRAPEPAEPEEAAPEPPAPELAEPPAPPPDPDPAPPSEPGPEAGAAKPKVNRDAWYDWRAAPASSPRPPRRLVTRPAPVRPMNGQPPRLPPPGPLAPQRKPYRSRSAAVSDWSRKELAAIVGVVSERRRAVALAALALTGAYVLVALGAGSEPSSSDTAAPPGGTELPLSAPGSESVAAAPGAAPSAVAGDARTLQDPEQGGPDAEPIVDGAGRFEISVPPDWESGETDAGSSLYEAPGDEAEVLVRVERSSELGLGELADRGAAFLAIRLPAGAEVRRIPARPEGELLEVARTTGGDEVKTAYVTGAGDLRYLLVASHEDDAPAMARLQAESVVRSFRPAAG